jgi:type IV pilus assembly protein PilM
VAQRIIGLDIGKDMIRAVEVENPKSARPMVLRYDEIAVPDGAVRSGEVREIHTVAAAIRKMWSSGGFKSKDVVLGMGNQRVLARDLTLPKMSLMQIRESLPFQVEEMLPVPVGDALLDFYPISEGDSESGPVVHGLVIAAIKEAVMANTDAVRQAGLTPVQVDLIPFALSRVLAQGAAAEGTIAVIDIGASTTNVVIATGGVPKFVRMIPAGGEVLTRNLVDRLELSPVEAEDAKRSRGLSSAPVTSAAERAVAEVIYATTTELLNSLRNTINYFAHTRQNEPIRGILLTGGGSRLPGFAAALTEITGLEVASGDASIPFQFAHQAKHAEGADLESMTVALGLALGSAA